jgi:2,3-bisphosphoglycerate-dependent phosphoglycerate mutase
MVDADDSRLLVLTRTALIRLKLILISGHGQSEWNKLNLFTGWKDPALTELGIKEAEDGAKRLKQKGLTQFDIAFTSDLQRAQKTCDIILEGIGQQDLQVIKSQKLNERDYGDLSGLNKDDARKKWGEEKVHIWRRSFDVPPPGGESLKLTAERVLPYWEQEIKPRLIKGEKVLIAAHGNSLRALIMELEGLSGEEIVSRELATGVPIVYKLDKEGKYVSKEVLDYAI